MHEANRIRIRRIEGNPPPGDPGRYLTERTDRPERIARRPRSRCGWAAAALAAVALAGSTAWAHGDAAWIQKKHPRCCGENDCHRLVSGSVFPVPGGYAIAWQDQTYQVGVHEALPSVDSDYWLCVEPDGRLRCLFAPMMGS